VALTTTGFASLGSAGAPIASRLPRGNRAHGTGTKARWHAHDHAGHPAWPVTRRHRERRGSATRSGVYAVAVVSSEVSASPRARSPLTSRHMTISPRCPRACSTIA
jgi:hypothetical protein